MHIHSIYTTENPWTTNTHTHTHIHQLSEAYIWQITMHLYAISLCILLVYCLHWRVLQLTDFSKKKIAFHKYTHSQTYDYPEICQIEKMITYAFDTFVFAINCLIIFLVLDRYCFHSIRKWSFLPSLSCFFFFALVTKRNVGIFPRTIPSRTAKNGVVSD